MIPPLQRGTLRFTRMLVLMASLAVSAVQAETIQVVTEELPPYNMTVDGRLTGMGTEVVEAMLERAGLSASVQSMPWARAYDLALHSDNVLIYSLARIPQREALFQWVGPIAPTRWSMYALASKPIKLASLDEAKAYQNGVVKQDVGELYLLSHGFTTGVNLQSSNRRELNYEKLKSGHIDLWIANELNALWLARQAGDDPARTLVRVLTLPDLGGEAGLFIAFSLKTPAATVERAREALKRIHDDGTYAAIARKWM